jgi:hypothetical protein
VERKEGIGRQSWTSIQAATGCSRATIADREAGEQAALGA